MGIHSRPSERIIIGWFRCARFWIRFFRFVCVDHWIANKIYGLLTSRIFYLAAVWILPSDSRQCTFFVSKRAICLEGTLPITTKDVLISNSPITCFWNMSGQSITDRIAAAQHSMTGSAISKAVCKATTHEVSGPKKKHLDCRLSRPPVSRRCYIFRNKSIGNIEYSRRPVCSSCLIGHWCSFNSKVFDILW